jgi:hypothetical protein
MTAVKEVTTSGDVKLRAVDSHAIAKIEEEPSVAILADEPDRLDRERRAELFQVDRHIGAGAAALRLLGEDLGERLLLGPAIDEIVAIDAPGAATDNAAPRHRAPS